MKMNKTKQTIVTTILIFALIITSVPHLIQLSQATSAPQEPVATPQSTATSGWVLVNDSRAVKAYPDLRETIWQKNATMAPNGPYDQIGLHRLVKTGTTVEDVVFLANGGMGSGGQGAISNPPEESYVKTESSIAYYLANRGFDVYGIDERRQSVPGTLNTSQVSFMKDWGWDVLMSDYKDAVSKAKEVSNVSKIFMMGLGTGAIVTKNYASEFWKDDIQGMILLSEQNTATVTPTNTYNLTAAIENMTATASWSKINTSQQNILLCKVVFQNPGIPAQNISGVPKINPATNQTWANVTEQLTFMFHYYPGWAPGSLSNLLGGIGNITSLLQAFSTASVYSPTRQDLESTAMADWTNSPYVTYDFNDHYKEINVPSLTIAAGLYKNSTGQFKFVNEFASPDFTTIYLANYGEFDIYNSIYTVQDVNEPVYQWLVNQSPTPTPTPTVTPTMQPTQAPTATPKPTVAPTTTPQPTTQPTPTPTLTASPMIIPSVAPLNFAAMEPYILAAVVAIIIVAAIVAVLAWKKPK